MTLLLAGVLVATTRPLAGAVLWAVAAATLVASILAARAIDRRPPLTTTDELPAPGVLEPLPVRARRPAAATPVGAPRGC
jgi:hypothetical protein